jgi:catechol-2,3-dioxygenase
MLERSVARPDAVRDARPMTIARIGHVGLTVTDLDAATDFFTRIVGLRISGADEDRVHLTSSHRWAEIRLTRGDAYGCDGIGLDVTGPAALDAMAQRAGDFGLSVIDDGPLPGVDRAVRVSGPSLPVLELCHGAARIAEPYDAAYPTLGPRPRKLGHVTFLASAFDATARVLTDYLGFRLSDTVPGAFNWYRCNADHHGIGLGPSPGPDLLHHYAFELTSFEQIRELADHLLRDGRELVWGPGRHGPGHNLFSYFKDPGGGMVEMYTDLLRIEDEDNYVPSEFTLEQAGNVWGFGTQAPEAWITAGSPYLGVAPVAA